MNLVKIIAHPATGFIIGLLIAASGVKDLLSDDKKVPPCVALAIIGAGIGYTILNYIKYKEISK